MGFKYIQDELGNVYDCYITQLSKDHNHLDKSNRWCDVPKTGNDTGSAVGSVDVGNVSLNHAPMQ